MAREIEARLKISAVDRTAKAFETLERRLKRAEAAARRANEMQRKTAALERATAGVERGIILGGGALMGAYAAAGGVRAGLTTLTTFENGLTAIQKKAGLTQDQMKGVSEEVKKLAGSDKLAVPIEEILAAYERGAAAGLPLDELRDFAELSAKAADAFEMSAADVGNATAGFKVGLGIPMKEMQQYFDLINTLGDSGISDEKDIINFLDRAGASLKNFGLSAQQAAAYGSALLNLKMQPEVAARMMSAMTSNLIAPELLSKKGQAALTSVVGNLGKFKKALKADAPGTLEKFLQSVSKMDKFQRAEKLGAIFGKEWSDEIMRLVEGLEELKKNLKIAATPSDFLGSLDRSYQLKLGTLSSQWQQFKNEIGLIAIDVGTIGLPALKDGLERIKTLAHEIGEAFKTDFVPNLDMKALDDAQNAIVDLKNDLAALFGLNSSGSEIGAFFRDTAKAVNEIAEAVKQAKGVVDAILHPEKDVQPLTDEDRRKLIAENGPYQPNWLERQFATVGNGFSDLITGESEESRGPSGPNRRFANGSGFGKPGTKPAQPLVGGVVGSALDWLLDANRGMNQAHEWLQQGDYSLQPAMPGRSPINPNSIPTEGGRAASGFDPTAASAAATPSIPAGGPMTVQFGGPAPDALRQAMEGASSPIAVAGADAASSIEGAAQKLQEAAREIGEEGRRAAEAISAARIQVPAIPGARGPNANLGQSMPTVGTPGG
ncbi:hypothetical protein GCM10007301_15520 [Azorhizobium oxalatiphilum]|uniref:Phage tail tape measure protein domain-containing protein n=1 Tax=Azorhizobium oxalatiphilum TaxID=980631 RepID=A0A917FA28_9HYPH|nr:phage tail tape measure protein [Azorhizobium oxalatiphilum]GGF56723.1 hypothetical protein GCM10007301_15520 [Azorhizobium oxalatiphilum]